MKKTTLKTISKSAINTFIALGLIVLAYEACYLVFSKRSDVFPEFFHTLQLSISYLGDKEVVVSLGWSIYRVLISLLISSLLAYFLALISARYNFFKKTIGPLIYVISAIPVTAIVLILILFTKITCYIIVFLIVFPLVYKASLSSISHVYKNYGDLIKLDERNLMYINLKVVIPLSSKGFLTSVSQALGIALKGEIAGELFMSASRFKGIGILIRNAFDTANIDRLFALTFLAIIFVGIFDLAIHLIKRAEAE